MSHHKQHKRIADKVILGKEISKSVLKMFSKNTINI